MNQNPPSDRFNPPLNADILPIVESLEDYRPRMAPPPRYKLTRFADVALDESGPPDIVAGVLPSEGLVVVYGEPKAGKSFLVLDLGMHVARGLPYRGRRVRQGIVVYCALEGTRGFKRRIRAYRKAKMSADDDPPFFLMTAPLTLVEKNAAELVANIRTQLGADVKPPPLDGDGVSAGESLEELKVHVAPQPTMVVIDTLNRSLAGSENSDEDMAVYIAAADAIRDAFNCLAVIVHHSGHAARRPRGHSSLMGAVDVQIAVKRGDADNIVAKVEAAKDVEAGLEIVSRLAVIDLGVNAYRDPITSCVVEEVDDGPWIAAGVAGRPKKPRPPDHARIVREAFVEAYDRLADGEDKSPAFGGEPVLKVAVDRIRDELRSQVYLGADEKGSLTATGRSDFRRARLALLDSKSFIEKDGLIWRIPPTNLGDTQ